MSVIRCPNCGKPNPDFLDACQYCDQPLKEVDAGQPPAEGTIRKSLTIRCPNCDKPNPDFLDVCQFCETPLKAEAARAAGAPSGTPAAGETEPEQADLPDWLRALHGEAAAAAGPFTPSASEATHDWEWTGTAGEAEPQPAPAEGAPDWLKSLQSEAAASAEAEPASAEGLPDWLKPAGGPAPAEAAPPSAEAEPAPTEDLPDWLKSATGPLASAAAPAKQATELPDWLKPAGAAAPAEPGGELPDWLKTATGPLAATPETAPTEDLPDWLKSATGPLAAPTPEEAAAPPPTTSPFLAQAEAETPAVPAEGMPDWLRDLGPVEAQEAPQPPALSTGAPLSAVLPGAEDAPDFLNDLRGTASPVVEEEQPDWLKSLGLPESAEGAPTIPAVPSAGEEEPDWMRALRTESAPAPTEAPPPEPEPDWLTDLRAGQPAEAAPAGPAVSPFAAEAAAPQPEAVEPDWLAALRPAAPSAEPLAPAGGEMELAQGELPSWLAAMRPVDVERPATEPEVDEYQETVGVLAGLRGVLRAEPSVVLPGKSAVQVHALAFNDAHVKQAELLAGMLLSDREAAPAAKRRLGLAAVPWERWLVAGLLFLGLLLPPFVLPGLFPLPVTIPAETLAAFQTLEAAPAGKPVLVAFDYEPGQAGELDPVAEALVGHAIRRGLPIVAVSTGLTGAGLSQEVLTRLTGGTAYSETLTYLNLGFLPGGPVGLLQFAFFPRTTFRADFAGRDFGEQGGLWELPVLRGINSLNDFGAVIVISAAPEDARAWIEQTRGLSAPLVLAVSAGSAPLIRPYFEAAQAAGLVSGVTGAMQYQTQAGVFRGLAPEPLQIRWEMVGGGLFTVALLLVLGNLVHGVRQVLARSAGRGRGKA